MMKIADADYAMLGVDGDYETKRVRGTKQRPGANATRNKKERWRVRSAFAFDKAAYRSTCVLVLPQDVMLERQTGRVNYSKEELT
jgi:hypothetical protein